jgi:magnesium transporter
MNRNVKTMHHAAAAAVPDEQLQRRRDKRLNVKATLYDAGGSDKSISFDEIGKDRLTDSKLLWIDLSSRDEDALKQVADQLGIEHLPCKAIVSKSRRPRVANFENFFTVSVDSVATTENEPPERQPIDVIVGNNFVITIHDGEVYYFDQYKGREKGETQIGELDAESFVAALLDQLIGSYFHALEFVEDRVDALDERVIRRDLSTDEFLSEMVKLRRWGSDLRRWLLPHRDLIHTFARSDFRRIAESESVGEYKLLAEHFDNAVQAVEASRDKVLSTFSLYATKSDQIMNTFIQRLTFITLVIGSLGVLAGTLGMNFKAGIFELEYGFWFAAAGMILIGVGLTFYARVKKWI